MNCLILLYTCTFLQAIFAYNITFGPKNNFFAGSSISNPFARRLYGQIDNVLLICYEDFDRDPHQREGDCELVSLDITNQKITTSDVFRYDQQSADVYEIQLADSNGPLNNFLLGYTEGPDSSTGAGKAIVGVFDITTMTIKYGQNVSYDSGTNDQTNIVELERNDSYFAVCFSVGSTNTQIRCRIGQYNVANLTTRIGYRQSIVPSTGSTDGMGIARVNNETLLVCWANSDNGIGECSIGYIDDLETNGLDSGIYFNPPVVFNREGGTDEIKITRVSRYNSTEDPDFVVCYVSERDGACSYLVVDIDGPRNISLQFKSRTTFAARDNIDQPSVQRISAGANNIDNTNELLMICYVDLSAFAESAGCVFGVVDNENQQVTFDSNAQPSQFEDGEADRIDAIYLGDNNMIVCYVDVTSANVNRAPCIFGTINNN